MENELIEHVPIKVGHFKSEEQVLKQLHVLILNSLTLNSEMIQLLGKAKPENSNHATFDCAINEVGSRLAKYIDDYKSLKGFLS